MRENTDFKLHVTCYWSKIMCTIQPTDDRHMYLRVSSNAQSCHKLGIYWVAKVFISTIFVFVSLKRSLQSCIYIQLLLKQKYPKILIKAGIDKAKSMDANQLLTEHNAANKEEVIPYISTILKYSQKFIMISTFFEETNIRKMPFQNINLLKASASHQIWKKTVK